MAMSKNINFISNLGRLDLYHKILKPCVNFYKRLINVVSTIVRVLQYTGLRHRSDDVLFVDRAIV
jgi:hypothetical protein